MHDGYENVDNIWQKSHTCSREHYSRLVFRNSTDRSALSLFILYPFSMYIQPNRQKRVETNQNDCFLRLLNEMKSCDVQQALSAASQTDDTCNNPTSASPSTILAVLKILPLSEIQGCHIRCSVKLLLDSTCCFPFRHVSATNTNPGISAKPPCPSVASIQEQSIRQTTIPRSNIQAI